MAYPERLLNENEHKIYDTHPHWSFMLQPVFVLALAIAVLIVVSVFQPDLAWVGLIVIAIALLGGVGRYLRWKTTEYVVTTDRILVRRGIIAKVGMEIPLDRVVNVSYKQSIWERILGTGDMQIESAGEGGRQYLVDVAGPSEVQNLIYKQSELYEAGRSGSIRSTGMGPLNRAQHTAPSIPEQLEKLAELRDRGIISDEDFEEKKQELLDRM